MQLSRHIALCLLLLLPCGVRAEPIGQDQASALQQQIKDWLNGLLGTNLGPSDLPLQVTGAGDHYRLSWPINGLDDPAGGATVTASLRPLDGGRWAIDDMALPDAVSFTATIPDSGDMSAGGPTKIQMKIGKQDSHAVIDPTFATSSTVAAEVTNVTLTTDSPKQHQEQTIDRYSLSSSLKPASDGRLDLDLDATMEGWRSIARILGSTPIAFDAANVHAVGKIAGVNHQQVGALVVATTSLLSELPPGALGKGGKPDLPAPARAQLRKVILAAGDLATSLRMQETLDGLKVEIAGTGGLTLQHALIGFGAEAPDGIARAWFDLGLDDLETPSLPKIFTAYLPHHIAVRPSISGVRTADLQKLALDASEEDGDDRVGPDFEAIFAHGGVDIGIEALAFDMGPAKLEGVGHIVVTSVDSWRGKARVSVEGLDELTDQARSRPELKQALPFLIMLRGLARPEGNRLVWDIASENTSVTVNGTDLSQLGGGDTKPRGDVKRKPLQSTPPKKQ